MTLVIETRAPKRWEAGSFGRTHFAADQWGVVEFFGTRTESEGYIRRQLTAHPDDTWTGWYDEDEIEQTAEDRHAAMLDSYYEDRAVEDSRW